MEQSPTQAPGWYADPENTELIRYWDGRSWTDQRRQRPTWAAGPSTRDSSPEAARRRRWWAAGAVALASVAFFIALLLLVTAPKIKIPKRTIHDTTFTRAANALCRREVAPLRTERPQPGTHHDLESERRTADHVDDVTGKLRAAANDLRALPVAATDQPAVNRWLDSWDRYVIVGQRYAASLRQGDPNAYTRIAREGNDLSRDVYVFAQANGMPECQFT